MSKPDVDTRKKAGQSFPKSALAPVRGIIAFDIAFSDATGHIDMWDGLKFSSEYNMSKDYWTSATRISVWNAPP
jgi:hypothetical protein